MTTAMHTPGPWTFYADLPSADPNWHIVTTANRMRVLANVHIEPGNDVDMANARLIAAAPDMLDALRRAVLALAFAAESSLAMQDDYNAVSAAIAKAIGVAP